MSASTVAVRAVRPDEYAALAELTVAGFAHGRTSPVTAERDALLRDVAGRAAEGGLLVAEHAGRLVGTVTMLRHGSAYARQAEPEEAELRLLTVDPDERGLGIGAALLAAGEQVARTWDAAAVVLDTGPRNASRRLYERSGYVRLPHRERLPAASGGLLVVYRKPLRPEGTAVTPPAAQSVLDTIGRTPLVRVNRLVDAPAAALWAKVEFVNPAGSIKDRIALRMVEAAEAKGELGPGSTIVDATSGNTGAGLALVAAVRGYRAVFVCSDKVSREKTAVLEAYGAEVIRTPSTVPLDDPRSARQTAKRLLAEIPGAWSSQQYDNPENPGAHFDTTGPEVWEQTSGTVTHLVANVGTGGTISGTGRFLKEVSDGRVEVIGADPVGSAYSGPVTPYLVEGAGRVYPNPEDWPTTYHREIVDRFVQVSDHDSFAAARDAARKEGLLVGPSSGTVLAAAARLAAELPPDRVVVALLTDSGRAYLSKLFDDEWLTDHDLGALVTRTGAGLPGVRGGPCAQVATVPRRSGDGSSSTA